MNDLMIWATVGIAGVILLVLALLQRKNVSFNKLVLIGLVLGLSFGAITQAIFGSTSKVVATAVDWIGIVGNGYISLLQMLVIPLIVISLISAFTKLGDTKNLGKIARNVLTVLLATTAIAAFIGVITVIAFNLQGASFVKGTASKDNLAFLQQHQHALSELTVPQKIVSFLPQNIFEDLAGTRATSTISVVIFSLIVGLAYIWLKEHYPNDALAFERGTDILDKLISRMVRLVINLTPYGIFSLMAKTIAVNSIKTIVSLAYFIVAVYVALLLVLVVHTVILLLTHTNPIEYYKKVWPTLIFAFTSRNSAGTLPMNVEVQTKQLGINKAIADFSASLGLSIGQNGCAGIYPAMIASITAPVVGINIVSVKFILTLIIIVTISSFGVAGSGGGATFAALIVLGTLNLPVGIMGIVLAIDPIIDMGRTLVNVNDSILAGLVTAKRSDMFNEDVFNGKEKIEQA